MPKNMTAPKNNFRVIVVGVSTGGIKALKRLLSRLPTDFPLPILIVQHIRPDSGSGLAKLLDELCPIRVKEAEEEEQLVPGCAYLAPANYHLLVERDETISLSAEPLVNFARPAVDVLFESAAEAFGNAVIGVILTGAGYDGARGMVKIKEKDGVAIVQAPEDAEAPSMPKHALSLVAADHVVTIEQLPGTLLNLCGAPLPRHEHSRGRDDILKTPEI